MSDQAQTYRILVSDNLADSGLAILESEPGMSVDLRPDISHDDLLGCIADYDALLIRSRTQVNAEVIDAANRLKVVGRAGTGTDNVDIDAATRRGVIVMNSPTGNTIAAAEHTMTMMLAHSRNVAPANAALRQGNFDARTNLVGVELYNKTLGILGLGRIGLEVAKRAIGFGMDVVGEDPYISEDAAQRHGIRLVSFDEMLTQADFITMHVPLTRETHHRFGAREFSKMKRTARIVNCARGGIIDEEALYEALKHGEIAGAALDVFEDEPDVNMRLVELPNVLTTPHLGASTQEAQDNIARDIAAEVVRALRGDPVQHAVNMPSVDARTLELLGPFISLAEKLGSLQAQLIGGAKIEEVGVEYAGDLFAENIAPLTIALQKGLLSSVLQERVNDVNAPLLVRQRGIRVTETRTSPHPVYANLVTVTVRTQTSIRQIRGSVFGNQQRIVMIDQYHTSATPEGPMLFVFNNDQPGMIGTVGTILGAYGVNIADMSVGRLTPEGAAVMVVNVDAPVPRDAIREIEAAEQIVAVRYVELP